MNQPTVETTQTRAVIAIRPENVPADWIIYYASRPIHGDMNWREEQINNLFFVAVNPNGEDAEAMIHHNYYYDAYVLKYFTEEEAYQLGCAQYRTRFASNEKILAKVDDPAMRQTIIDNFVRTYGRK